MCRPVDRAVPQRPRILRWYRIVLMNVTVGGRFAGTHNGELCADDRHFIYRNAFGAPASRELVAAIPAWCIIRSIQLDLMLPVKVRWEMGRTGADHNPSSAVGAPASARSESSRGGDAAPRSPSDWPNL
jgi:hypothetical protein